MASENKKRRRSSLCSTKMKIQLSSSPGRGLHQLVDGSLPPEQRLARLTRLASQNTVDIVRGDPNSQDSQGVQECLDEARTRVPAVVERSDVQDKMQVACSRSSLLPNPQNIAMDNTVQDIQAQISRLQKEETDWKKYFADLDQQVAQAERRLEHCELTEDDLTPEQRVLVETYLPSLPDLSPVMDQVQAAKSKTVIHVNQHIDNLARADKFYRKMENKCENKNKELYGTRWIQQTGTPQTNVKNILKHPNPTSSHPTSSSSELPTD